MTGARAAAEGGGVVADFDGVPPVVTQASGLTLTEVSGKDGNRFLRITSADGGLLKGGVVFRLPAGATPGEAAGVAARVRPGDGTRAKLRWLGVDEKNRVVMQRRVDLEMSDRLQEVALPWNQWRWGEAFGGGPGEIRKVGIWVDEGTSELELDDLRLIGAGDGAGAKESSKGWLLRVAFGGRDIRVVEADGMLVGTDAVGELGVAELTRNLRRMQNGRAMLRRLFGPAVNPMTGSTPATLLIFRRQEEAVKFFEALGKEWNVRIVPPAGPGMTVQNLATALFDRAQGAGRPVFLHESVHAVMATELRLLCTNEQHRWLQEGLASYVQAAVYPNALDRKRLAEQFGKPIEAGAPPGSFQPLDQMLGRRNMPRDYPQLAALIAYLVDQKPQWLPTIAAELASGRTPEQAFRKCGTTLADLQAAWMQWGAAKVAGGNDAGVLLPVPDEFRNTPTD